MNATTASFKDFLARFFADLSKAIFAVGLASSFFEQFSIAMRIFLGGAFFALAFVSFILYPKLRRPEHD